MMGTGPLIFRIHAIKRMFQRRISKEDVQEVLETGETIETYPDDKPYSSRLLLGWRHARPLHIVAAENAESGETIVVTAYEPSREEWQQDFKKRRTDL